MSSGPSTEIHIRGISLASAAMKQLSELQRAMYERAVTDAKDSLGGGDESIAAYTGRFEASLPDHCHNVTLRRITQAIDSHNIILFGDFHSHKQCQRALLRILRTYKQTPDHAPIILAVEMFRSMHQEHLNAWLNASITDEQLLDRVEFHKTWGFPWNNYRPILEFCRTQGLPVVAINSHAGGKENLRTRDEHAASIINQTLKNHPSAKLFCMIGEHHLATSHLPAAIQEDSQFQPNKKLMRIVVNADKYYFSSPPERINRREEYLELASNFFCILNSPPWMKWQSQALWEEQRRIGENRYITSELEQDDTDNLEDLDDDEYYTEEAIDLDHHILQICQNLGNFFRLTVNGSTLENFNILHESISDELDHMPAHTRASFLQRAAHDGVAVDYKRRIVYIPELSVNNFAYASGQILFGAVSRLYEAYEEPDDAFIAQILKQTFGFLANKVLNPRLPLHTRSDIEDYVAATKGKRIAGMLRLKRDTARASSDFLDWALKFMVREEVLTQKQKRIPNQIILLERRSSHEVTRNISQALAAAIYSKLMSGRIDVEDVAKWFKAKYPGTKKMRHLLAEMLTFV